MLNNSGSNYNVVINSNVIAMLSKTGSNISAVLTYILFNQHTKYFSSTIFAYFYFKKKLCDKHKIR